MSRGDLIGNNGYQDLLISDIETQGLEPDKNVITDVDGSLRTIDQDTFTNTDGNITITQTDRNFNFDLNITLDPNKNVITDGSGRFTTENKDSFINVANQISWSESAGRVFTATLPQDIATNSNVQFNTVKTNELVGNYSKIVYQDTIDGLSKFFYPEITGTATAFSLGKSNNKWTSVHSFNLNLMRLGDTYINPYLSLGGNLGDSSYIWDSAHINNINTNNINAIGSTINFNNDLSGNNITSTNITSTNITVNELTVDTSMNILNGDIRIYESGSNPSTTQTRFENSSVSGGTISTTTNTDDTFTSNNLINRSGAIGVNDLVLSSNPLTSFTCNNEFEITQWNNNTLFLGFIKNTYSPATSIFGTNPKVFLQIGSGNDLLAYYNSSGTPNITSLSTSSTIGTVGYKYTFDIDNNKNLTIDKYTPAIPGTTSYVSFTTGSYTTNAGTRGRYVDVQNPSSNTYRIRTWNGSSYNNVSGRLGYRSDTSFKFEDYSEVKATFTIHEINQRILYVGFIQKDADLSNTNTSINQQPYPYKTDYYDFNANNTQADKFLSHTPPYGNIPVFVNVNITFPTGANLNDIIVLTVNNSGNLNIDWYDNSTSTWNYGVQTSTITLSTTQEYNLYAWDNNTTSSRFDISAICELTSTGTPATTQQIFNSASTPTTPFTLDNDSYRLFVSDNTTSQTQYEVVIDGSITDPGTLVSKFELNYLTADKNLILDANNLIQVEDKDTITGTTNQINVNQVGRAFTLSTPQDIATNSNVSFNTVNGRDVATDGSTLDNLVIDVNGFPDALKNLTSGEINQLENINTITISNTQWQYVGAMDQNIRTSDDVDFNTVNLSLGSNTSPSINNGSNTGIYFPQTDRCSITITGNETLRLTNSLLRPVGVNLDLGTTGGEFNDLFLLGDITVAGNVDGRDIATDGTTLDNLVIDVNGFPDALKNLTSGEINQLENINTTTISNTQWGYVGGLDQALSTNDNVEFQDIILNGDVRIRGSSGSNTITLSQNQADSLTIKDNATTPQEYLTFTTTLNNEEVRAKSFFTIDDTAYSRIQGYYNGTATIIQSISTVNTWTDIDMTLTEANGMGSQDWTLSSNVFTYTGTITKKFHCKYNIGFKPNSISAQKTVRTSFVKNTTVDTESRKSSFIGQETGHLTGEAVFNFATNDTLKLQVKNITDATNFITYYYDVIITEAGFN